MLLKNKTALITGASRGIGKAIAERLAKEGCNIAIAAKTTEPHPKLEGTIYTAAKDIEALGVQCLPLQCDIRYEEQIEAAVEQTVKQFGGIDILINNASAISLTPTEHTEPKRFDLMMDIEIRGTFFMCKSCIPYLRKSTNAHILNLSPPLNMNPKWFAQHLAYTIAKYGMSMIVVGLAEELKKDNIAVNALWPATSIATAAIQNLLGGDAVVKMSRTTEIVAEAALAILSKPSTQYSGQFFIDEEVLRSEGVNNFGKYAVDPSQELLKDFFLD